MIALYITLHLQHHNLFFFARKTLSSCFIPSSFVNNAKQMHLSFIVGHIPLGDVQIYCMKFINMFKNQKKSSSISSFFFVSFVCTTVVSYFSPFIFVKYNSNIQIMLISRHRRLTHNTYNTKKK